MGVEKTVNSLPSAHPLPFIPSRQGRGQDCSKGGEGGFSGFAFRGDYPRIAFRSASGVLMGIMLKFFTSTSRTFGVMKAGRLGPNRMFLIPR